MATLERRLAHGRGPNWTDAEVEKLIDILSDSESTLQTIQKLFPHRSRAAIRSKIRKVRISQDLFGNSYREDKMLFTKSVAKKVTPKAVFEAYAGVGHQTFEWINYADVVFAADKMLRKRKDFEHKAITQGFRKWKRKHGVWDKYTKKNKCIYFYQGDAVEACVHIKHEGIKIDLVDLDTCGSTLPTLPIFLSILQPKEILITHGEFHSLRFRRKDVLKRVLAHRDIDNASLPSNSNELAIELDRAVKLYGLRAHNETRNSFWLELEDECWLGKKNTGMLRRHYRVERPVATADCLNSILKAH